MAEIRLSGISAAYPLIVSNRQMSAFAHAAQAITFGRLARDANKVDYVVSLDNVSLDIAHGSSVGLIGRNGAGKSTLLKVMAGIVPPRAGIRRINGSIGCVLNPGAGLDMEKSALQNMRLIGRLYGLRGDALDKAIDEAASFSELGGYVNLPMRTYSAGMIARVAFAIATSHQADIMLVDEAIGAGDAHFINRAIQRIQNICSAAGISVVASHSEVILKSFCTEAIWLSRGRVQARGPVAEVWADYAGSEGV